MQRLKRVISVFLAVLMLVTLAPVTDTGLFNSVEAEAVDYIAFDGGKTSYKAHK